MYLWVMKQDIAALLPGEFPPGSRVWIYQSNRPFNELEEKEINEQLLQFTLQWHSHTRPVQGWGRLLFSRFIVLIADESEVEVSGCSTDSSVHLLKSLERQYGAQLFDRMTLAFLVNGKVELLPVTQVQYAFDKGYLSGDSLFFNNMAATKAELERDWLIPVKNSWLMNRIKSIPVI